MVEAIKIYTSPEVLERLMSIFIIRINKPSLRTLSPRRSAATSTRVPLLCLAEWLMIRAIQQLGGGKALVPVCWPSPVDCCQSGNICIHRLICVHHKALVSIGLD